MAKLLRPWQVFYALPFEAALRSEPRPAGDGRLPRLLACLRRTFADCKAAVPADLDADRVLAYLAGRRALP